MALKRWTLDRFLKSDQGVFGTLEPAFATGPVLFTCEDDVLFIAPGVYKLRLRMRVGDGTITPYPTYEVEPIPGRDNCIFHPGNTEEDTLGCVLPGMSLGVVNVRKDQDLGVPNKKLAVLRSRDAFTQFMAAMGGDAWGEIDIRWHTHGA